MEDVLGHDYARSLLRWALDSGRMHHAWIFHGPEGVGKRTLALQVARELLGAEPRSGWEENHPDLHVIYKELAGVSDFASLRNKKQFNIPIDLLRERMLGGYVEDHYIEPVIGRKAMLNRGKAFIIDEAELLDAIGQNAILKTLEEPPPGTFIFLITSNEDRLLPTIRSRCQRVAFSPLEDAAVEQLLGKLPQAHSLTPQDRRWVVRFARGSIGRAVLAAQYRLDAWAQAIEPGVEAIAAGRADADLGSTMAGLVDAFAESWVKKHKGASKDAANKAGVRHMLGLIAEICRQRLHAVAGEADPDDPISAEQAAAPWLAGIERVQEAQRNLESNVHIGLLLDNLAIQWASSGRGLRLEA